MVVRKLNKSDYTVGQVVALRYDGNASRYEKYGAYKLEEITKIGSKILYVGDVQISMATSLENSNYSSNYILYDSEQHLIDVLEGEKIIDSMRHKLGHWGFPNIEIEKLRQIKEILDL